MSAESNAPGKSKTLKIIVAVVLVAGAAIFVYAQYRRARPTIPATNPAATPNAAAATSSNTGPLNLSSITPEQRRKFREEVYAKLNLTPEQRTKLDAINKKFDAEEGGKITRASFIARLRAQAAVLTPEQRNIGRQIMQQQFRQRLAERIKVMPPDQQKAFMDKFNQRFEERRKQFEANTGLSTGPPSGNSPAGNAPATTPSGAGPTPPNP